MSKQKKGGFYNLLVNNEPQMFDKYGNKINYNPPSQVGNINSYNTISNISNESNIESLPYYNMSPYKEILGKIASKDMNKYRLLTCSNQRKDVKLLTQLYKGNSSKMEAYSIKNKLNNAKIARDMCFSNSKRKLMEIKNNMQLTPIKTAGKKTRKNKKKQKLRKTYRKYN